MTDNRAVILSGVRTAIGTFGGSLAGVPPTELASAVTREAISRAGLEDDAIDSVVFGNVIHTEPRDMYLSRVAAIEAGLPVGTPALTLNRLCGSGLQAIATAADQITLGHVQAAIAGGAESMSRAPHASRSIRTGQKMGETIFTDMLIGALSDPFGHGQMGVTAENVAEAEEIGRDQQDAFAAESHRRAATAISEGRFAEQILALEVKRGRETKVFDQDEGRGDRRIDFVNLPRSCKISIFTAAGKLVRELQHNAAEDNRRAAWDLRNKDGLEISHGVYFYAVEAQGGATKIGKFAVIK